MALVCRATPAHVVRCVLGSVLRAAVWGSAINLGLSLAGRTQGFWATKVVAVSVRTSKKLLTSRFNLRETKGEAVAASKEVGMHSFWRNPCYEAIKFERIAMLCSTRMPLAFLQPANEAAQYALKVCTVTARPVKAEQMEIG